MLDISVFLICENLFVFDAIGIGDIIEIVNVYRNSSVTRDVVQEPAIICLVFKLIRSRITMICIPGFVEIGANLYRIIAFNITANQIEVDVCTVEFFVSEVDLIVLLFGGCLKASGAICPIAILMTRQFDVFFCGYLTPVQVNLYRDLGTLVERLLPLGIEDHILVGHRESIASIVFRISFRRCCPTFELISVTSRIRNDGHHLADLVFDLFLAHRLIRKRSTLSIIGKGALIRYISAIELLPGIQLYAFLRKLGVAFVEVPPVEFIDFAILANRSIIFIAIRIKFPAILHGRIDGDFLALLMLLGMIFRGSVRHGNVIACCNFLGGVEND